MPFKRVEEFQGSVLNISDKPMQLMNDDEHDFVMGCLLEEVDEINCSHITKDYVGCIDGYIDLIYFAMGGLTRMGLSHDVSLKIFEAVHQHNMLKVKGIKDEREVQHENDAIKPEGWVSPEEKISQILDENAR